MSDSRASLADLVRTAAAEDRGQLGPPPSSTELAGYVDGKLSEAEAERVRDHLVASPEVRDLVLELRSFPRHEPPSEEYRVSDEELGDAWNRMKAELGIEPEKASPLPRTEPVVPAWVVWLKMLFTPRVAVPAALAAASFVLGITVGPIGNRDVPRLNALEVVDLVSASHIPRSSDPAPLNTFSETRTYLWILSLMEPTEYPAYDVEILGAGGEAVWSAEGTRPTSWGHLNVVVPGGYLAAGSYTLRLFGVRSGQRQLIEEYPVRIEP